MKRTIYIYLVGHKRPVRMHAFESEINTFLEGYATQVRENKFDVGCGWGYAFNNAMITHIKVVKPRNRYKNI